MRRDRYKFRRPVAQHHRCKRLRQTSESASTFPRALNTTALLGLRTAVDVTRLAIVFGTILRETGVRASLVADGVGPVTGWDWSARRFLRRGGASYAARRIVCGYAAIRSNAIPDTCGSGIAMGGNMVGLGLFGYGLGSSRGMPESGMTKSY